MLEDETLIGSYEIASHAMGLYHSSPTSLQLSSIFPHSPGRMEMKVKGKGSCQLSCQLSFECLPAALSHYPLCMVYLCTHPRSFFVLQFADSHGAIHELI